MTTGSSSGSGKDDSEKKRALEAALHRSTVAFGKGSVMRLGQREGAVETDAVSTGSLASILPSGSRIAAGRVVEIYGPESSGKTTLALQLWSPRSRERRRRRLMSMPNTRSIPPMRGN